MEHKVGMKMRKLLGSKVPIVCFLLNEFALLISWPIPYATDRMPRLEISAGEISRAQFV
jgi:hypothetical protein